MDNRLDNEIKLLLVEDDEDFSSALVPRLAKKGFNVIRVGTAEEALVKVENFNVDVIIADIKLPGIDGIEFLARVREINRELPVILITGYASLETAKEAVRLKATDYLLKPLENIEDLLNPIYKAAYTYRLVLENRLLLQSLRDKIKELERSERKYRDLFEAAGDIIYTTDGNGIITSVNKKMEEITKYEKEELIGRPATDLILPAEGKMHWTKIAEILEGSAVDAVEVKIATKDGTERSGKMGIRPIEENGKITGKQCIVRHKRNEEE